MLKKSNLEVNNFGILKAVKSYALKTGEKIKKTGTEAADIIYVTNGKYTYSDNLGNQFKLGRGEVQAINSSNEIEYTIVNEDQKELTFIQFEIITDGTKSEISSEAHKYKWKLRINQWLEVVSHLDGEAEIRINQDLKVHVLMLDSGLVEGFAVDSDRSAYLIQLEGSSTVNGKSLVANDRLEIMGEDITLTATDNSHIIILEMAK